MSFRHITWNSMYCYNKRSISLCFQMPNRTTTPKCWNYVEVESEKNVLTQCNIHCKVLSLMIHIADFDWTLIYRYLCFCAHMRTLN